MPGLAGASGVAAGEVGVADGRGRRGGAVGAERDRGPDREGSLEHRLAVGRIAARSRPLVPRNGVIASAPRR
jgi:hypothetical protein